MSGAPERVVIVGAGQAGGEMGAALRMAGFTGEILLLGAERHPPYARPPLSKAYLSGSADVEDLYLRSPATYAQHDITLRLGVEVTSIDRDARRVEIDDGTTESYDRLVIATGGRPRTLPGAQGRNVFTLRTVADVDAMRSRFAPGARLVVLGGGYIGLEVAAVARQLHLEVTVLEAMPRVLARVTAPQVSRFFERVHREEGVDLRVDAEVVGFDRRDDGDVGAVRLKSGESIPADAVLIGVGLHPNVELGAGAGLAVDDGIIVDEFCRTSDRAVLAIGDCTRHPDLFYGGSRRLESVANAIEQARTAAALITDSPRPYDAVPWFWSDQFDIKLQMIGLSAHHDDVIVRGEIETGRTFTALYLADGAVVAADVASTPRDFAAARKLIVSRAMVDRALLADPTMPLKGALQQLVPVQEPHITASR